MPDALKTGKGAKGARVEKHEWPFTTSELSQNLILSILRGNAFLCERMGPSVVQMFSTVANQAPDVSVSPALDFFFIITMPEVFS